YRLLPIPQSAAESSLRQSGGRFRATVRALRRIRGDFAACLSSRQLKLEGDLVAALELENFTRLVRTGDLEPEAFDDLADLCHLFGIGLCVPALAVSQTYL